MFPFLQKFTVKPDELSLFIRQQFGFKPKTISLYERAFRHKSTVEKSTTVSESNERLEFLGDAILTALVSEFLYERLPQFNEGKLTKIRSGFVSRGSLNHIGEEFNLISLIRFKGHAANFKSLQGNVLESLIGAIYLDQGHAKSRKIIREKFIIPYLTPDSLEELTQDYKSQLYMWAQKEHKNVEFKILEERIKNKKNYFVIALFINNNLFATAEAFTKKEAEKQLAEKASGVFGF
ncbi:MAG: ribonuclease III [Flavobacteriales bacterium]